MPQTQGCVGEERETLEGGGREIMSGIILAVFM